MIHDVGCHRMPLHRSSRGDSRDLIAHCFFCCSLINVFAHLRFKLVYVTGIDPFRISQFAKHYICIYAVASNHFHSADRNALGCAMRCVWQVGCIMRGSPARPLLNSCLNHTVNRFFVYTSNKSRNHAELQMMS